MQAIAISQDEELHWLALRLVPGLGTRNAGKLIDRFRTPQAVLRASRTELEAAGVSGAVAHLQWLSFDDAVERAARIDANSKVVSVAAVVCARHRTSQPIERKTSGQPEPWHGPVRRAVA